MTPDSLRFILFFTLHSYCVHGFNTGDRSPILQIGRRNETMAQFIARIFHKYNSNIPPSMFTGKPVLVKVSILIHAISSISVINMDYSVNMFLRQYWSDPRLHFHDDYNQSLTLNYMRNKLWVPDLYFINEKEGSFHVMTTPNLLLRLSSTGDILFSQKITVKLSCPMKLEKFPMDEQKCVLKMESYGYTTREIMFEWVEDKQKKVEFSQELELPEFDRPVKLTGNCTLEYLTGSYSCLYVEFRLKRKFGYYLIQTYIPSVLIVILSWVSFWIDVQAVPARISLGLLTVLSITTQSSGVRGQLPRVSYVKAIDVWMSNCLVFVFGALIEYAIANVVARASHQEIRTADLLRAARFSQRVQEEEDATTFVDVPRFNGDRTSMHREDTIESQATIFGTTIQPGQPMPLTPQTVECEHSLHLKRLTNSLAKSYASINQTRMRQEKHRAERIDRLSRAGFPITFICFNIGYWLYYLKLT